MKPLHIQVKELNDEVNKLNIELSDIKSQLLAVKELFSSIISKNTTIDTNIIENQEKVINNNNL